MANSLGEQIERLRHDAGLSREALAARAGISWRTILRIEQDRETQRIQAIEQTLKVLGYRLVILPRRKNGKRDKNEAP